MTSSKAVILLLMIILLLIAVALISRLLRHVNSFEQELLRISNVFLSQGDYDSSLSVLKKIHEAGRCHGPCLLRAGLLEKRRGNFQDGVRYCKEAVAKGNTCGQPEAWNCLFASYMGQGRYGDATAALSHLRDCHHLSSPLATLFAAFEKSHDRLVLRAIHHLDIITPDLEKKGKGEDQLICHYSRVLAEELGLKHLLSDLRWPTASCPDFLQPKAEGTELNELEDKKKLDQPMVSSMVDNEFSGREKTVEETVQDIELITSPPSVSAEAQEEIVPDLHRADQAQTEVVVEAGEKEVESRVVRDESVGDASVVSTKNLSEHIDPQIVTSTAPSLSPSEHIVHVPVLREATGYEVEIPTESNQEQKDKQNLTEEPQTANIGERDALVKEDAEPDQELTVSLESRQKEQDEENFGQEADSTIIEEVETAASSEEEVERLLQRPLETDQGQAEGSNEVEEVEVGVATQTKVEAEKTEPSDSPRNELEPAQTVVEHQQGSSESVVDEVSLLTTSPTDQLQREGKEGEPKEEDSEPVEAPAPVDGAVEAVQVDEDVIQNADDLTRHVSNVQAPTVTERNVTEQGQEGAIISDSAIPEIRVSQENKTETTLNNSESLATPLETSQATKDLNHTQLEKDKGDILIIPGTPSLPEPSSTANETLPTANSTANNELSVANASHALPTSSQAIQLTEAEKRAIASARPYLTLALAYLGKDDTVNGMKQLDKVLKKAPKYADALFTRGSVYMDLGDIDKAVQDLKIVYRDLDPGNATVFEDLETALMAYLQQQQYPAAYEIYQLLVKDLPVTTKQTAWALTEMLEAVKEYSQAANLWEEMVRQELIRSTDAIPILAQLYNRMGELEKAESYYLQAIELQMASYQTLGVMFLKKGVAEKAIYYLEKEKEETELKMSETTSVAVRQRIKKSMGDLLHLLGQAYYQDYQQSQSNDSFYKAILYYEEGMDLGSYDKDVRHFLSNLPSTIHSTSKNTSLPTNNSSHANGTGNVGYSRWVVKTQPEQEWQKQQKRLASTPRAEKKDWQTYQSILSKLPDRPAPLPETLPDAAVSHRKTDTNERASSPELATKYAEGGMARELENQLNQHVGGEGGDDARSGVEAPTAFEQLYQQEEAKREAEELREEQEAKLRELPPEQVIDVMKKFHALG